MTVEYTAAELSAQFGLALRGDGDTRVSGVATLANAGPAQLGFLANPRYRSQLQQSHAGIVVMREDDAENAPMTALIAGDPYAAFARIAALFEPRPLRTPGIHASADIAPDAVIDPSAHIAAFVSIGAGSHIGAGAVI
ncbi:MAG: LpxD N-terminal domain-containing protein, partial [Pseudomonadota bacterium]|nr:LpxD N-terminal domain-containing protein [Pseudomonadota bacterium]